MNKVAVVFGGSGYIGKNLLQFLIAKNVFDKYFIFDIRQLLGFEYYVEKGIIDYKEIDVRRAIKFVISNFEESNSRIFNFVAIHREPGHEYKQYFDTNISGGRKHK